jgi:hypothetical protein
MIRPSIPRSPYAEGVTSGNVLCYGDNLDVLRQHVADESVDLIYLDPPFNSNAAYNLLSCWQDGSGRRRCLPARRVRLASA